LVKRLQEGEVTAFVTESLQKTKGTLVNRVQVECHRPSQKSIEWSPLENIASWGQNIRYKPVLSQSNQQFDQKTSELMTHWSELTEPRLANW